MINRLRVEEAVVLGEQVGNRKGPAALVSVAETSALHTAPTLLNSECEKGLGT